MRSSYKNPITCSTENCRLLIAHQSYTRKPRKNVLEKQRNPNTPPPPASPLRDFPSLPRANGACACSECLVCALTRLGGPEWRKVDPATPQKGDSSSRANVLFLLFMVRQILYGDIRKNGSHRVA